MIVQKPTWADEKVDKKNSLEKREETASRRGRQRERERREKRKSISTRHSISANMNFVFVTWPKRVISRKEDVIDLWTTTIHYLINK